MTDGSQSNPLESPQPASAEQQRALHKWLIIGASVFLTCLLLVSHPPYSNARDYIGYALGVTAWLSYAFFIVAYVARPMQQLFEDGWRQRVGQYALRQRRYFGLGAALVHTVHFGYVAVYVSYAGIDWQTLIFGGAAFLLLWAQALTSNARGVKALGPRWKLLHRTGMHYLWVIYTFTLFGGMQQLSFISTLLFASALFAGLLRFAASRR